MSAALSFADVAEGVRATIAAYTHALDDGRTDEVVATFCSDGGADLPGMGTIRGHEELRAAYARWAPRAPQRHLVLNTHVTDWGDHEATSVSDVVFLLMREGRWSVQLVGRYRDVLHRTDGAWLFHQRVAEFVTAPQ